MKNSMTYHHICAVINTEIQRKQKNNVFLRKRCTQNQVITEKEEVKRVRILDMGCGNGELIVFLSRTLPQLLDESIKIELYGFDISDYDVRDDTDTGFLFEKTISYLTNQVPSIEWKDRVALINSGQEWPFPENFFDFIYSNQVMEHVMDHNFSFQQIKRTLKEDGVSVHLFPLKNCILEGHMFLPFVHRISNIEKLKSYIKICALLLGRYRKIKKKSGITLNEFLEIQADFMTYGTNYLSKSDIIKLSKTNLLKFSFKYTEQYYWNKVRSLLGLPCNYKYRTKNIFILDSILFLLCVRVAGITLLLSKENKCWRWFDTIEGKY